MKKRFITHICYREERKTFIRAKYEKRRYAITTCSCLDDWLSDLKQAVLQHDLNALLQVYAEEGADLMAPLPDTVRTYLMIVVASFLVPFAQNNIIRNEILGF